MFFFFWLGGFMTESATKAPKTKLGVFSKPFFIWAYHPKTSNMTLFLDHQRFSHLKLILRRTSDRCLVPVLCDKQALDIWWSMVISFQQKGPGSSCSVQPNLWKKKHTDHEIPIPSPGNIRPDERMSPVCIFRKHVLGWSEPSLMQHIHCLTDSSECPWAGDKTTTLQGINISHFGKRKIIFKMPFLGDMLVSWRVSQEQWIQLVHPETNSKITSENRWLRRQGFPFGFGLFSRGFGALAVCLREGIIYKMELLVYHITSFIPLWWMKSPTFCWLLLKINVAYHIYHL